MKISNKNTPQNVNKSPDKKKTETRKTSGQDKSGSKKHIKEPQKQGSGIAGTQLGTEKVKTF